MYKIEGFFIFDTLALVLATKSYNGGSVSEQLFSKCYLRATNFFQKAVTCSSNALPERARLHVCGFLKMPVSVLVIASCYHGSGQQICSTRLFVKEKCITRI